MLFALVFIAYMLSQLCWLFFDYLGLWVTWEDNILLYDSLTKLAGVMFFISTSTMLTYKLSRGQDVEKKEETVNVKNKGSSITNILKNILRYVLKKAKKAGGFLKKSVMPVTRFLYSSRKTVLLVTAVFLVTLIFSFLIATWFSSDSYAPNDEYDRNVPTTGTIKVQGLEIYGGDIKYDPGSDTVYVDWGELTLGVFKNSSFYVKSNSTIDVHLELNVTNWEPPGIEEYLVISWDYNGTSLSPYQEVFVTVTLEVPATGDFIDFLVTNEVTAFGFDIIVYSSQVYE